MPGAHIISPSDGSTATDRNIRVLIVDDSRTVRSLIRNALNRDGIEVVGDAGDPYEARDLIKALNPDVLTLDVEMPRMDGLSFLERLMRLHPMPVIMVSTRTTSNSNAAIRALSLGAVDCIDLVRLCANQDALADLVVIAAKAQLTKPADVAPKTTASSGFKWNGKTVLIGSSTGGVDALTTVLHDYPEDCPPTIIAQHMPESFLSSFAERLDGILSPKVALVSATEGLEQGRVLLAPGGSYHAVLKPRDARVATEEDTGETYVPSVSRLFRSALPHAEQVIAVMLTGMGSDGANEMLELRTAGAHTIVQSGETCVVDGMPRVARELGAAVEVVPLPDIGEHILKAATRGHHP